ncbi:CCA tRNA nucleotidyltransferase [Patescibacteria group bacterium]|nr:CCA tRNA nucleotidyltransferase [Patescibacteria group bacterium]
MPNNITMKIALPKEVNTTLLILEKAGFQAYAVGGCVRDIILLKPTKDWDFTTDATPEEIIKLFPDSFYDNKFGTVGVEVKTSNGKKLDTSDIYEITTFRSEMGYSDHRHPDKIIWGKTLEEDLERRDFTINAMATNGEKIIDLYGGQKDISQKLIKAVGDANLRFTEDALRMMRAIRIATELQFLIEEKTFMAIKKNASLLAKISTERVRDELLKVLASDFPADGIMLLKNAGLLPFILPELEKCFGVEQKSPKRHHIFDVGTHLLMSLKNCPSSNPIVRLATLLHDIGKPATFNKTSEGIITFYNHEIIGTSIVRNIAQRLHLSKKDSNLLLTLVRYHQFTVDERQTDTSVRRFIRNVTPEYLTHMLHLRTGDRLGGGARETSWRLELFKKRLLEVQKQPFTAADLKIDGYDVMKIFDTRPGPLVGKVLDMLFNDVVEGKLPNEREILLTKLKELKSKKILSN